MDSTTLTNDITAVLGALNAIEGFLPNSQKLQTYNSVLQNILTNPTLINLGVFLINYLATPVVVNPVSGNNLPK